VTYCICGIDVGCVILYLWGSCGIPFVCSECVKEGDRGVGAQVSQTSFSCHSPRSALGGWGRYPGR
jgi:hypothetical protein